jgi:hypothetical protein
MNRTNCQDGLAGAAPGAAFPRTMVLLSGLVIAALLIALPSAHAVSAEDQYLQIYGVIEQADGLAAKGKAGPALAKYREAQIALQTFQQGNPSWNAKLVAYRAKYLAEKVATLSARPVATPAASEVKLLEPGAEPRKLLRLHPKPGDKQTVSVSIDASMEVTMGEMPSQPIEMPLIKLTADTTAKSISADGEITYEMTISDVSAADEPGVMPQVAEALKASLAKIKGLSGTSKMSDRGRSQNIGMTAGAGSDAQTQQVMDQIKQALSTVMVSLPEEPVGTGAKWAAKTSIKSQGMAIDQTGTYEIASLEGERVVVKSDIAQRAANQKIQIPSMPGLKIDLTKMAGKGSGETTLDLAKILPQEGAADLHADLSLAMNAGGQTQAMTMKTEANFRLESK